LEEAHTFYDFVSLPMHSFSTMRTRSYLCIPRNETARPCC